jgi:phosphonate metabolism protein PhnN/1,5-bisphosphokinase (PRPP-forming)
VLLDAAAKPETGQKFGSFVAVVGPSGAGKDSLISGARERLLHDGRFVFARRFITRPADESEPYESISPQSFDTMEQEGGFSLSWRANGLGYALAADLTNALAAGKVVVANLSREIIPIVRQRFASSLIIHVTAPVDVLRERIASRGREEATDRELRLARSLLLEQSTAADIRIVNDGPLHESVERFVSVLISVAH